MKIMRRSFQVQRKQNTLSSKETSEPNAHPNRPFWLPLSPRDHGVYQHWAWTLASGWMAGIMTWRRWLHFITVSVDGLFWSLFFSLSWFFHTLCYLFLTNRIFQVPAFENNIIFHANNSELKHTDAIFLFSYTIMSHQNNTFYLLYAQFCFEIFTILYVDIMLTICLWDQQSE